MCCRAQQEPARVALRCACFRRSVGTFSVRLVMIQPAAALRQRGTPRRSGVAASWLHATAATSVPLLPLYCRSAAGAHRSGGLRRGEATTLPPPRAPPARLRPRAGRQPLASPMRMHHALSRTSGSTSPHPQIGASPPRAAPRGCA
eukprot:2719951-Prymnesium_polylepis.2